MCFRIVAIVVMNHVINSHFFVKTSLWQHSCAHESYRGRFGGSTTRVALAISQQMSPGPSIQLLDDDGSTQLDYGRDHATINGAAATINGSRCTKCVCAGGTAISGWLLCESRCCFHLMVVESSRRRLVCFFFRSSVVGGGEGGPLEVELELAVIDEKDAWWSRTFWHLWHMCCVTVTKRVVRVPLFHNISLTSWKRLCIYGVHYECYYRGLQIVRLSETARAWL